MDVIILTDGSSLQMKPKTNVAVQFSSVQGGIYALGKADMHSTPSLRSFPNIATSVLHFKQNGQFEDFILISSTCFKVASLFFKLPSTHGIL